MIRPPHAIATCIWLLPALLLMAAIALPPAPAGAVVPSEMMADPKQEKRAREISKELRCLVCQNQSIDDSDAELAKDLRVLVRERIAAGDSDKEVLDFVVHRYGDFVLLRPPVKGATFVLWAGPAIIALMGVLAVVVFLRRNQRRTMALQATGPVASTAPETPPNGPAAKPLTAEEQARLKKLLEGDQR